VFVPNKALLGSLDWIVKNTPPAGAGGFRVIVMRVCRFLPMVRLVSVNVPLPVENGLLVRVKMRVGRPGDVALTV